MESKFCIYTARNKINGKIYVGKTNNLDRRIKNHLYDINNGLPFHRALKKYGFENFEWKIIDTAETDEEIRKKEIYWIKKLNTCINFPNSNGYNLTLGGEGGVAWNSKPVVRFDLNGNYIDEYVSCSSAATKLNLDRKSIERACKIQYAISGDYQWRYKDEWNGKNIGAYKKPTSTRRRKIVQIDKNGYVLNFFESIQIASETLKISRTSISACLSGKNATAGNYQFIYEEDYDIFKDYKYKGIKEGNGIVQLDENWNVVNFFNNCTEAARFLGEPDKVHQQIHKVLKLNKKCRGYYWRKYDEYFSA